MVGASAPRPPFLLPQRDPPGSAAKIRVRDAAGQGMVSEVGARGEGRDFRLPPGVGGWLLRRTCVLCSGGAHSRCSESGRAAKYLGKNGDFRDARFELIDRSAKYSASHRLDMEEQPFIDSHQLNGLKIIVMLTSNWDNKDRRDSSSNTGIVTDGRVHSPLIYMVADWGGSMGRWGNFFTREKWDCDGYSRQSSDFVKAVDGREVKFGFAGQHDGDFRDGITARDVRWVMRYLGRITDAQIRAGLHASGADPHEQQCIGKAIRQRLNQLRQVSQL